MIRIIAGACIFIIAVICENFGNFSSYFLLGIFLTAFVLLGYDIIFCAVRNLIKGHFFDENFFMGFASTGAFAIGQMAEAVGVVLFYQIGECLQETAVHRSRKSITALMDIRPEFANLKNGGSVTRAAPETVNPGDIIIVRPGEKIPLDGNVIEGDSMLDTRSLTGESVPRRVTAGGAVLSGCVNLNSLLTIEVTKTCSESAASKILELAENAVEKKAPVEKFITRFAEYYTPGVVILAFLVFLAGTAVLGGPWQDWLRRALIMLVISCPCALIISIPLGFFGGIGAASRNGILVKGGNYLDALNYVDTVVFDKTGTLTKGVFNVTGLYPADGFDSEQLLELAAAAESHSVHPIALSIKKKFGRETGLNDISEYEELAGYGVRAKLRGKLIYAGSEKFMHKMNIAIVENESPGTAVYVAAENTYAGCIVISDEFKPDSKDTIGALRNRGADKIIMLSGDDPEIVRAVTKELELDEVYGGVLPQQKMEKLEQILRQKKTNKKVAYVGDGINDAPSLALADVGIAMGGLGSDAAIEAADIVLMTDEPSKLAKAMDIAGFTKRIVWQNIVLALGVKGIFLILGAAGIAGMWEAVFADVGVALLAVFNSTRVR
ncbi:MAG: cadmium-translocating P-type ATPase [Treponema sp.]|nr:cadmium-translocating P-type ATPase [Treponema sp.]